MCYNSEFGLRDTLLKLISDKLKRPSVQYNFYSHDRYRIYNTNLLTVGDESVKAVVRSVRVGEVLDVQVVRPGCHGVGSIFAVPTQCWCQLSASIIHFHVFHRATETNVSNLRIIFDKQCESTKTNVIMAINKDFIQNYDYNH